MISANNCRQGFTLIEMSIASVLMALLALILSESSRTLGRATVDLIARAQLAQEMDFAAAALSRDLGGCVVNSVGQTDTTFFPISKETAPPSAYFMTPRGTTSGNSIQWRLDNNDEITYRLDASNSDLWKRNNLIRIYHDESENKDTTFTVARNVDSFLATWSSDGKTLSIGIDFSCNFRYGESINAPTFDRTQSIVKRTCVFVTNMPSPKQL